MTTLRAKTISGMCWSLLQNIGGRGLSFIVTIILARLLTPEIFGLIGMVTIFIQLSQTVSVAGFNEALIQKKDTSNEDYSSVFWLNLLIGILLYFILFFTAPFIARFYNQPLLTGVTRVLSLLFVINAFSCVSEVRLRKKMEFRTLMIIHIPSIAIAALISIILAYKGFGVWSIVAMQLTSQLAYAIQLWIYSKWRPMLVFNKMRVKELFSFGGKMMAASFINTIYRNIYLVIIGKFFPLNMVGYYQAADKMVKTPSITLSTALNSVAFPAFSSIQDDNKKLKDGYRRIITQLLFWICPAFVLAAVLAQPIFGLILGRQWLPAVPFFQLLCIAGIFYPLNSYNLAIVNVKGRSDISLKLEIVKKIITTIGILIAIPFGIWALVGFQAINSLISYYINSYFSGRFIHYPITEQLRDIFPILGLSLVVGSLAWVLNNLLTGLPDWPRLLIGFSMGGGLYWILARFSRFSPYLEFIEIVKSAKNNSFSFK